jgi:type II secretory pathway component PulC
MMLRAAASALAMGCLAWGVPVLAAAPGPVAPASGEPARHEVSPPGTVTATATGLELTGIVVAPEFKEATFARGDGAEQETVRVREGDKIEAAVVKQIGPDWVEVEENGVDRRITLAKARGGTAPVPNVPAFIRSADPRVPGISTHLPPVMDY